MAIVLLILVGLFVIIRPRLAFASFVFLVSEIIKALIIVLFLGTLVALYIGFTGLDGGSGTQPGWLWGDYGVRPAWTSGYLVVLALPLVTILLVVIDLIKLSLRSRK